MKTALALALAALLAAGCGGDDDDDGEDATTGAETTAARPAPPSNRALFESSAVGFTFEYPKDWAKETKRRGDVIGQVSVEPGDEVNAIRIRQTADRPLGFDSYLDELRRDFEKAVDGIEKDRETIAGRVMGILRFERTVERDGEEVEHTSTSYFFTGASKTWQVECVADADHREEVDGACRTALESVTFGTGP